MILRETTDTTKLAELSKSAQTGLTAYNLQSGFPGNVNWASFGYYFTDKSQNSIGDTHIQAAACCRFKGSWVHIDLIWVNQTLRGHGYGQKLLQAIEEKARDKGCIGLHLTTFEFQAPDFYIKHGFETFATLDDFPIKGHQRLYMIKRLG